MKRPASKKRKRKDQQTVQLLAMHPPPPPPSWGTHGNNIHTVHIRLELVYLICRMGQLPNSKSMEGTPLDTSNWALYKEGLEPNGCGSCFPFFLKLEAILCFDFFFTGLRLFRYKGDPDCLFDIILFFITKVLTNSKGRICFWFVSTT